MTETTHQGLAPDLADSLLALPLFDGIPKGAAKLLTRFARVEVCPPGTEFVQQNEFTTDFFIVLQGVVTAYRTEPDGRVRRVQQMGPGDWFGELSALSNQTSPAQLKTDAPSTLVVLEAGLFKDLYNSVRKFRGQVDGRYRETSLELHLAVVPAFATLDTDQRRRLRKLAKFDRISEGEVIVESGEPAEAIHLVRSGAVTFHRRLLGGSSEEERLDGYLMTNSSFGEHSLWEPQARWEGTYRARTDVELLTLPVTKLRDEFADSPEVLQHVERAARQVTLADRGEDGGMHGDELHGMVHRGSVKGGEALVIDLHKCVRCNACVESCVAVHEDRVPRLSKKGFRVDAAANKLQSQVSLVTSCYHCETPGCMMSCSYGAIRRDPQGLIRFIGDNCVGCAMCVSACPYDVIRLTEPPEPEPEPESLFARIVSLGGLLGNREAPVEAAGESYGTPRGDGFHKEHEVRGRAIKCDRCEGLPFEACVYNCPCGAIDRRSPAELFGLGSSSQGGV
jgi:Fe-S-cluster-containing dehydrogenase component/CRP-like cAMP-binding protein